MAERYKIYEKLGSGGVGAVFRAYDSQLKRWVAVKRIMTAKEAAQHEDTASELRREADALASLRNPNIVTIFDVASDDDGLFMVMELLQGEDLADVVARGPLPYDDFKELASQSLEGMLAAHQHHILHRDIKPENIKVERLPGGRLQAKIIDFGLARAGLLARKQTEDQSGTVMGSIYYMAPEQLTREPVDERTDLYSLGCVFYEALSGKKAFDGESVSNVIDKHINHDVTPLHVIAPHVPQWLDAWCARLMAQKPGDRPANAQLAIEEFRAWEKMPPMMPYGMYGVPPMYTPPGMGTAPLGAHYPPPHPTTSGVPTVQPEEDVPVAAVAVEVVPEVMSPVIETAAITTPLAPAPRRTGGTGRSTTQPRQPSTVLKQPAPSNPPSSGFPMKWAVIGGAVALVAAAGWFFMKGSKGSPSGSSSVLAAVGISSGPPKVSVQLPMDRAFPPVDRGISLFHVADAGSLTNRKGSNGKPASAGTNDPVMEWHDISERGGDNILRPFDDKVDYAPKRAIWPVGSGETKVKANRVILDFRPKGGKPCALVLDSPGKENQNLPFGDNTLAGNEKGLTLIATFQADAASLPTRLLTLDNDSGGSISLVVDEKKNLVATAGTTKLVTSGVNASLPCVALIRWNAETGVVELRARDVTGKTSSAKPGKAPAPKGPLTRLQIGQVKDAKGATAAKKDQFSGYLGEVVIYSICIKPDQFQLNESRSRGYYFETPPVPPKAPAAKAPAPKSKSKGK
ncbi:MAG: serine/threonine-protein kinase [Prosthecobacter sp.]